MMAPIPMPADFPEHATQSLRSLANRYGVGRSKVLAWRRSLGITIPRGAPKGNGNAVGNQSRKKQTHGMDDMDAVRTCLSCTAKRCTGQCQKVR